MQGRLPLELENLRDCAENNVALSMVEQEVSHLALGFIDRAHTLLRDALADGHVDARERERIETTLHHGRACVARQLDYDVRYEELGRRICGQIGKVRNK